MQAAVLPWMSPSILTAPTLVCVRPREASPDLGDWVAIPHSLLPHHSPWALSQPHGQVRAGRILPTLEKWPPSCQAVLIGGNHTRSMEQEFQAMQCHVPPKQKGTFGQISVSDRFAGSSGGAVPPSPGHLTTPRDSSAFLPAAQPHGNLHSKPNTSLFCKECFQARRIWQTNPLCLSTCGQGTLPCAWP